MPFRFPNDKSRKVPLPGMNMYIRIVYCLSDITILKWLTVICTHLLITSCFVGNNALPSKLPLGVNM